MQEAKPKFRTPITLILCALSLKALCQHTPQTSYEGAPNTPSWARLMYENPQSVDQIRAGYEEWRKENPDVKNQHSQYYKRWLRQADWSMPSADESYVQAYREANLMRSGEWSQMGPWHYDPEVAMYFQVQSPGSCHVYTVEQSESNPDVVYCGTATAGAYKSTDKGLNWELITRDMPITQVYSIAIDKENEDIVWIEGGGDLYRSDDGGETWTMCGQGTTFQNYDRWFRTLMQTDLGLFAATNNGLWFTDDMGTNMQLIADGEFMELEQHPTNPSILYTVKLTGSSTQFMKSTDGGMTFEIAGTGWPIVGEGEEQKRAEISISPADPNRIYALCSGSTSDGGGLFGYYVSYDEGESFEFSCCGDGPGGPWVVEVNPNILGWSGDGSGDGGQYYYDLAHGASPTDPEKQFSAGISVWRTENSGADWSLNAHWVTWAGDYTHERYTHADVHDIKFFTQEDGSVDMWVASDGGLFYSSNEGDNIEPRMYGLHGTDFWGWQSGWRASNVMVGGTYHNGTLIRNDDLYHWGFDSDTSGGWLAELAGDNFRGFVNPADGTRGYHDNGAFNYSNDRFTRITGAAFDNSKNANTSYWYGEYGNFAWDPTNYNKFYSPVGSELWVTEDGGANFTLVNDFEGEKIISVKVSPLDPNRIYVSHKSTGNWKIHTSADGGTTWEIVSIPAFTSDFNNNKPIYLDVDGNDPLRVYAIILGTQDDYLVFQSFNAGNTWQNITTNALDDEHVVSIAHQRGTEGGLYLGTTRAVYYKDDNMDNWELFNSGLPMFTAATFLQPDYCGGNIRVAGPRSVHQSPFYSDSEVQAAFMASQTELNLASPCHPNPIHFSDVSVTKCEGATYEWTLEGGSPSTASGTDVYINYTSEGLFDVSLTVTQADGSSDTKTWEDLINVTNEPVTDSWGFEEDFDSGLFPPENWRMDCPNHAWEQSFDLLDETNGVAQFPNYWVNTEGGYDMLITPGFDPTQVNTLQFDYAHMKYGDYVDGLEVWCRLDIEDEWTQMWFAYGDDLSVENCYTWFWYDTGGEAAWETVTLVPPNYWHGSDANCAEIAFVNVGGYGNHIWIDNVMIGVPENIETVHQAPSLQVYPNPSSGIFNVSLENPENSVYTVTDSMGRVVKSGTSSKKFSIDLTDQSQGLYMLSIPDIASSKLIVK